MRRAEARLKQAFHRILLLSTVALEGCHDDVGAANALDAAPDAPPGPCSPMALDAAVDAADPCALFVRFACGLPSSIKARDNCYLEVNDCEDICGQTTGTCHGDTDSCLDGGYLPETGPITIDCVICPSAAGRRTQGLKSAEPLPSANAIGAYFSHVFHLEAASVIAFRRLGQELELLGAPRAFVRSAARARRDEIRHARVTRGLALRFGGQPRSPRIRKIAPRPLEVVAFENAVEGCVRETYGALVATWQASHASDPSIASEMTRIAKDETRHAALAWEIARWSSEHLSKDAHDRLKMQVAQAIEVLESEIAEPAPELTRVAGLPTALRQRSFLSALRRGLWAPFLRQGVSQNLTGGRAGMSSLHT